MYLKPGTRGTHKFDPRWECGCWLGVKSETGEIIVGTSEGVVKARDFKRLGSPAERWDKNAVLSIRGTPWEPIPGRSDDAIPSRVHLPEEGSAVGDPMAGEPKDNIRRRARISRSDIIRVG